MLPRRRGNESQASRCDIFPTGRVVSGFWAQGPDRGVSGARRGLRHEGAVQEGERKKENKREQNGGRELLDRPPATSVSLYPVKGQGWQMRSAPTNRIA